jgi:hypothetical protein
MNKAFKALKALNPEQEAILRQKTLSGSYTPRAALALLRPVAEFDRLSDTARTSVGCWAAALGVVAFISFVITMNGFRWAIPVVIAALGGMIYFIVAFVRLKNLDVSNNLRQIAMPFFAVLNEDMDKSEKLRFRLELSEPTAKTKKTGESAPYKLGAYHKVVDTTYKDDWFDGSARLTDGSLIDWSVSEEIRASARTKKTARGKYKTKTKYYKSCLLSVEVALPNKEYAVRSFASDEGEKIRLKEGEKRTTVRLSRKLKLKTNDPFDARELIGLIAEAYKRVKPAVQAGSAS